MTGTDAPLTVAALLHEHERLRPDALAIQIDGQQRTWAQVAEAAREAAAALRATADPQPGERVSLVMANDVAWVAWAFGASLLGCTFVPINTRLRGEELAYQLRHSGSVAIVCAGDEIRARLGEALRPAAGGGFDAVPTVRAVLALDGAEPWTTPLPRGLPATPTVGASPDDVLLIQYTSGTTAFPKGVMLTHRQVLTNARGVAGRLRLTGADRLCSPSPFFHVAGTTLLLFLGLVTGARVISFSRFEPGVVLDTIEREQASYYSGVETFFLGLLKHADFDVSRLASVRTGWIAASSELVQQVHEVMGLTGVANVYGISEASPNVTIADAADPPAMRQTCGRPHSGTEVRIVALDGGPAPAGESGLIEVRGPCVMKGYLDDPEQTAATISADGWLTTGDRGHVDADGNLVYEGRAKDMLRVGGENVAPAEIEAVLLAHPELAAVAVVGVPHDRLVEVPAAFVVPHPGHVVSPEQVTDHVAKALAPHKVPRLVIVTDELPMTGSGKVQKHQLAERARSHVVA